MDKQSRLKIAIQKSGRLTDLSLDLLTRCGLKFSRGKDQLICHGENMPLDILLVDDEDQIRFVISALLESDSHRVDTANDGVHGLRKFKNGSFDLVITDRAMPSMNGEQLAVAIKEISPNTPVVLLSGFVTSVESGDIPGVDVIAGKPIRFDELREAINRAVKRA